jgi:hypothetical protein
MTASGFKIATGYVDVVLQDSTGITGPNMGAPGQKMLGGAKNVSAGMTKSFGGIFSSLSSLAGPALGPLQGITNEIGGMTSQIAGHGKTIAGVGTTVGLTMTGIGAGLTALGSGEKQASDQLAQSFTNAGFSVGDFSSQIDAAVSTNEQFGHSAEDTKNSLSQLVTALGDPTKAIGLEAEAANLAAAQHISLADATSKVIKVVSGTGSRTLAQFGIVVQKNADGTKNYTLANQELADKLNGQAAAATDNVMGHLKALGTVVLDNVSVIGEKYGPAITAAGAALTVMSQVIPAVTSALGLHDAAVTAGTASALAAAGAETVEATATAAAGTAAAIAAPEVGVLGAAMDLLEGPLGWVALGLTAIVGGLALFMSSGGDAQATIKDLDGALKAAGISTNTYTDAVNGNEAAQATVLGRMQDAINLSQQQEDHTKSLSVSQNVGNRTVDTLSASNQKLYETQKANTKALQGQDDQMKKDFSAMNDNIRKQNELQAAVEGTTVEFVKQENAIHGAMQAVEDDTLAMYDFRDATDAANASIKTMNKTHHQTGVEVEATMRLIMSAGDKAAAEAKASGKSIEEQDAAKMASQQAELARIQPGSRLWVALHNLILQENLAAQNKSATLTFFASLPTIVVGSKTVLGKGPGGSTYSEQVPTFSAGPRIKAARGGIFRHRPGGVDVNLAEASLDEAVVPLDGKHNLGDTYGDIHVTIPARDIAEMKSVTDFFASIKQQARKGAMA